jgi:hypothetical protein
MITFSYSTFVDLSTGLARTWHFNRMRHRNVEFNSTLLELSIDNRWRFKTYWRKEKSEKGSDWRQEMANWKTIILRLGKFAFARLLLFLHHLLFLSRGKFGNKIYKFFIIRWHLFFEMDTLSICRWRVDTGRFLLRPGLHLNSLHLHSDTNAATVNYFRLRHSGK